MATQDRLEEVGFENSGLDQGGLDKPEPSKEFNIQIDRVHYTVTGNRFTGAMLRRVPPTPIPPDRDIFQIVPGRPDRKIEDGDRILIRNGLRFFTAPNTINPGFNLNTERTAIH